jgi:CheY-like chemotaxis protein
MAPLGIATATSERPDLILMDLDLPGILGLQSSNAVADMLFAQAHGIAAGHGP